jgi:hypothetical protein
MMTTMATDAAVLIAVRVFLFNQVVAPVLYVVKCVVNRNAIEAARTI